MHTRVVSVYILCALSLLLGLCRSSIAESQVSEAEDNFIDYVRGLDLGRREDLRGNIAADRRLSANDMNLVLRLSDVLIDDRLDFVDRGTAARALGQLGHQYAIPSLLAVLRDEDERFDVRQRAVIALSMIRDKRAVRYLIEDGLGSGDDGLAEQALWELVQFAGAPKELRDKFYVSGFKPPPKGERERKEYLETWFGWWAAKQDEIELERVERFAY